MNLTVNVSFHRNRIFLGINVAGTRGVFDALTFEVNPDGRLKVIELTYIPVVCKNSPFIVITKENSRKWGKSIVYEKYQQTDISANGTGRDTGIRLGR